MNLKGYTRIEGVFVPESITAGRQFETDYINVRLKENRVYTDAEVAELPKINTQHPHYKEWQIRRTSFKRLFSYLAAMPKALNILEIGCGNGWLSNSLAQLPNSTVAGSDINLNELQQAARVFKNTPNLRFFYIDDYKKIPGQERFDMILFAASIQYFPSIKQILNSCLPLLNTDGEIHISDTHIYRPSQVTAAKQRTYDYYNILGCTEMSGYYYHHTWDEFDSFNMTVLYNPGSLLQKLKGNSIFFDG